MYELIRDRKTIEEISRDYLSSLGPLDLVARNSKDVDEYRQRYVESFDYNDESKDSKNLEMAVKIADRACIKYKNISKIKWKFAICLDELIESGYPHTHRDIIILTPMCFTLSDQDLAKTLVHEKVHVFQRKFAIETQVLLMNRLGLVLDRADIKSVSERSNPDLFNKKMIYSMNSISCSQVYYENPRSLADSRLDCFQVEIKEAEPRMRDKEEMEWFQSFEHPYEGMAYTIADILFSSENRKFTKISKIFKTWMSEYF